MAPSLSIGRLDQESRRIVVDGARAGERLVVSVNGATVGRVTAFGSRVEVQLARPLRPGSVVTVTGQTDAFGPAPRSSTLVQNDFLQYHYDLGRTGWNNAETALTTGNVNNAAFGHLFSLPVDAFVYASPLFMGGLTIGGTAHNTVFVVTENDSAYAFDSDTGAQLWHRNYASPGTGAVPIPYQVTNAQNIIPAVGITSTPAIDPNAQTMYFVAAIQQAVNGGGFTYHQFLHAVDATTGLDRAGSPVDITATALLNNGKPVAFDALSQLNRASILLANGSVYVGWGNHDDTPTPSTKPHGWLFKYDAGTLALQAFFNTTLDASNKYDANVWGGGWGPDADASGNIFFATGDGPYDGAMGGHNWGDTVMKLTSGLTQLDYFTPGDQATLNMKNHDLGGGGVMLLPDQPGSMPRLAVVAGEEGTIYLMNRDALGGYVAGGPDNVVQELPHAIHKLVGGPSYYSGTAGTFIFYCGAADPLEAYQLSLTPVPALTRVASASSSCGGSGGAIPVVSSNGSNDTTAIVWITTRPANRSTQPVLLRAYAATNLGNQLIQEKVALWQNPHNPPFISPTVAGGRVFVPTSSSVEEYGLYGTARPRTRM